MMDEILYLEPDEEITSVIDKLKDLPGASVALVLPKHAQLASSVVNLRLLQAEAKKRKKTVAIVTHDKVGMKLAAHVGIPVYRSVTDDTPVTPDVGPRPPVDDVVELHEEPLVPVVADEPAESTDDTDDTADEVADSPVPVKRYDQPAPRPRPIPETPAPVVPAPDSAPEPVVPAAPAKQRPAASRARFIGILCAALVLLGAGSWWLLIGNWHADARIALVSDPYEAKTTLVVDNAVAAVDETSGILPGQRIEATVEKTASFPATGKKDVGTKASGTVTVSNRLGEPVNLAAGTRFDRDGLAFVSTEAATVPAATVALDAGGNVVVKPGTATVRVESTAAGDQYNVAPGAFTITSLSASQREKVTASNQAVFAGGSSKTMQVVTDADIDRAKQSLVDQTKSELVDALRQQSPQLTVLADGTAFDIVASSADKESGSEADTLSVTATVRGRAVGFTPGDYQRLVVTLAGQGAPEGKQVVSSSGDAIDTAVATADVAQGKLTLTATLHTKLVATFDTASLAAEIAGKTVGQAQQLLGAHEGVVSATVTVSPAIRSRLPNDAAKITITPEGQ